MITDYDYTIQICGLNKKGELVTVHLKEGEAGVPNSLDIPKITLIKDTVFGHKNYRIEDLIKYCPGALKDSYNRPFILTL